MGHYAKFIAIDNNKASMTHLSSSIDIVNVGTNFLALSIHARDFLKNLSKVGKKGYQIYGFHPYSYNENIEEEMTKNPLGKGHLNNDSKSLYDVFTPFGSISINHNWERNYQNPFISNTEDAIKEANSPYEYIIDYDNKEIILCVENHNELDYTVKKISFEELDTLAENTDPNKQNEILDILFEAEQKKDGYTITHEQLKEQIKENFETSITLIKNADLNNEDKFDEIIKNNMFIFNNCINKEDLLMKVDEDIKSIKENGSLKKIRKNR